MMNLFALTQEPSRRILRIPLSQNVQAEVEGLFKQQESDFDRGVEEEVDFDGKYKPDHGERLTIKNYDDMDNIHDAIANPLSVQEITPDPSEFSLVKALFTGYVNPQADKVALIQSFDKRKIISPAGMSIFHSNNVYRKVDGVGLTLDNRLSAVLVNDVLKFFSFHVARQAFDLSQYYVEATNSDLEAFVKNAVLHVEDEAAFLLIADSWIRRKVTLIAQSQILDNIAVNVIKHAALAFGIQIETKLVGGNDTIVLPPTKAELKKLLRFLDEDYYQSTLQSRNYVTNSKRLV